MQLVMWLKNIVAAGLADRCEVQLAYAIGVAHPVSILVDTFGTNKVAEEKNCKKRYRIILTCVLLVSFVS